jgi:hypothetical protein
MDESKAGSSTGWGWAIFFFVRWVHHLDTLTWVPRNGEAPPRHTPRSAH